MIQLGFPGPAAPGVYGIYAALQLLLGGPLPFQYLRDWLEWARHMNPMAYYFNVVLNLEMRVGENGFCGESCEYLFDMYGNKNADLFWNGMFLVGLYLLQLIAIYIMLSMQIRKMDTNIEVIALTDDDFKEQTIVDIADIKASEFDNVDTDQLFKTAEKDISNYLIT